MAQAERDLEQAEDSRKAGRHEWACFAAQQAGEKTVKALHLHNIHPEGLPFEHYGPLQSEEAIGHAGAIIAFVRSQMA
jgi:hypothetical protein